MKNDKPSKDERLFHLNNEIDCACKASALRVFRQTTKGVMHYQFSWDSDESCVNDFMTRKQEDILRQEIGGKGDVPLIIRAKGAKEAYRMLRAINDYRYEIMRSLNSALYRLKLTLSN